VRAPELEAIRPGDFIKVRGSANPLHQGGRAVVVAVHRSPQPPFRVAALDVRYSARGQAIRVEISGAGELARWETPWAPTRDVEEVEHHHDPDVPVAAHEAPGIPRRRLVVGGAVVLALLAVLLTWEHERTAPNPVVVERALTEGVRGTGSPSGTATPFLSSSPTTTAAVLSAVVAYSEGPVPVVAGIDGTNPVPLAGVEPAPGCRDAYVKDFFSFLPIGQRVEVDGAGWFRTDDGLAVNAELVRTGRAVVVPATAGDSALDQENLATLQELAADAPQDCG
jgi:hypothetical protein